MGTRTIVLSLRPASNVLYSKIHHIYKRPPTNAYSVTIWLFYTPRQLYKNVNAVLPF